MNEDRAFLTPVLPTVRPMSHRVNESPLTFIRAVVPREAEPMGMVERAWFEMAESAACWNRDTGTHYRECLYGLAPMREHEQFDTMLMRRLRTLFTQTTQGEQPMLPASVLEHHSIEMQEEYVSVAVPKHDPRAYSERAYLLLLGQDPVAKISIEHAIEEILEKCEFLRDPESSWISRPDRLHVLLAVTDTSNATKEERAAKRVVHNSPPVILQLHKFEWRREGTLHAQWHCVGGNIDRLRADLRIASKAVLHKCFTSSPEDQPTLSRPFAVETLVMALLVKPTPREFEQLVTVTDEMSKMFTGVTAKLGSVTRVAQLHDHLDREAMNGQEADLELDANFPYDDPTAAALRLVKTSPTIKRLVGASAMVLVSGAFIAWKILKHRK